MLSRVGACVVLIPKLQGVALTGRSEPEIASGWHKIRCHGLGTGRESVPGAMLSISLAPS